MRCGYTRAIQISKVACRMIRKPSVDWLQITVDRRQDAPISRQIFQQIRSAILNGRLRDGDRLPSSRILAEHLRVSRTTLLNSYDLLYEEGLIEARRGSGTTVSAVMTDSLHIDDAAPQISQPKYATPLPPEYKHSSGVPYDFRPGTPAWDLFPRELWARTISRVVRHLDASHVGYGPAEGAWSLRKALARHLRLERGMVMDANEIIITSGATQAIDLLSRIAIRPGGVVVIEDPSHPVLRETFRRAGAFIVPVPVDENGCQIEKIEAELIRYGKTGDEVQLIYLTPTCQFPVGSSLSMERRVSVLKWACDRDVLVIDDDYDGELNRNNDSAPMLHELDSRSTAHIGTFSKTMYPGLRLGYAVLPDVVRSRFIEVKWQNDRLTQIIEQYALAEFMESGRYRHHVQTMGRAYARRRRHLAANLRLCFGDCVSVRGAKAGLHLLASIKTRYAARSVARRALSKGVRVYPAENFYYECAPPEPATFLLGYASMTAGEMKAGLDRLATAAGIR